MVKLLCWVLCIYVLYTQYLISGYNSINDNLQRANDTLLRSCISPIENHENNKYE